jgi:hypothetical protein
MGSNQKGYKPLVDMDYKMWGPHACVRPVYTFYIITLYIHTRGHDTAPRPCARLPPLQV